MIRALNLSIHCNEQQAMLLATIVDREGRSSVRAGSNEFCARAKEEIQVGFLMLYPVCYEIKAHAH